MHNWGNKAEGIGSAMARAGMATAEHAGSALHKDLHQTAMQQHHDTQTQTQKAPRYALPRVPVPAHTPQAQEHGGAHGGVQGGEPLNTDRPTLAMEEVPCFVLRAMGEMLWFVLPATCVVLALSCLQYASCLLCLACNMRRACCLA